MKKQIGLILTFLVFSLLFTSCSRLKTSPIDGAVQEEGEKNSNTADELVIPLTKLSTLDPIKNNNISYYNFSKLIYQGLFEFNKNLDIVPLLVESYRVENEGKTLVVELKDDIYWHNGDRLTSEDIAYTIETIQKLDRESIYSNMFSAALGSFKASHIKKWLNTNIIDDKTIEILFDEVYSNNLEALTFPIINKNSYNEGEGKYTPIGTGPYKYISYKSSNSIDLVKNDNYWKGEVGIGRIRGRIFQDEATILKAFQDGRIDMAYTDARTLEAYKKDSNNRIFEYTTSEYEFLGYNFKNSLLKGEGGRSIREAIYYGIDRQEIIERVYLGHATQVDTPIHPNSYLTDGVTNKYGHYVDRARSILNENGFTSIDSDGILKDSSGRRLSFRLITNSSNNQRMKAAEIIRDNLKEIGVEIILEYPPVDLDSLDEESIDSEWESLNKTLQSGSYDITLLGWDLSLIPDVSFMYHSAFKFNASNFINYNDKLMDDLLEKSYMTSREDKQESFEDLQNFIMEELPYSSLYFTNNSIIIRDTVKGPLDPTFFNMYRNLEKCKILEEAE